MKFNIAFELRFEAWSTQGKNERTQRNNIFSRGERGETQRKMSSR